MRQLGLQMPYVEAIFEACWEKDDTSIQTHDGLRPIVESLGVASDHFETLSESEGIRNQLIETTNRGLARGVFGAPSMFVGNELFWGKDRMEFIEEELLRT